MMQQGANTGFRSSHQTFVLDVEDVHFLDAGPVTHVPRIYLVVVMNEIVEGRVIAQMRVEKRGVKRPASRHGVADTVNDEGVRKQDSNQSQRREISGELVGNEVAVQLGLEQGVQIVVAQPTQEVPLAQVRVPSFQ